MGLIRDLPNLGPASENMLHKAGIKTPDELFALGEVMAYWRVSSALGGCSLNLLYALYGAIHDCHWAAIPRAEKSRLLIELDGLQQL